MEEGESAPVPTPLKLRRRPVLTLAGAALVVLGALVGVWVYLATSESTDVVAVRSTVMRGEVIGAEDLAVVQVGSDPSLAVVPGSDLEDLVGRRAALDLAAGSLLTQEAVTKQLVPADGESVVGVAVTPQLMPGEPLVAGDRVRVVVTAGTQGDPAMVEDPVLTEAEVVSVRAPDVATGQQATVVSVLIDAAQAPAVAQYAAAGRVALVLESREG